MIGRVRPSRILMFSLSVVGLPALRAVFVAYGVTSVVLAAVMEC